MAVPPFEPEISVYGRFRPGEGGGEQDGRRRCLRVGAFPEPGSGDGADGEGRHDEHQVAADRGVEPDLALVEAEVVLGELEALLSPISGAPLP